MKKIAINGFGRIGRAALKINADRGAGVGCNQRFDREWGVQRHLILRQHQRVQQFRLPRPFLKWKESLTVLRLGRLLPLGRYQI